MRTKNFRQSLFSIANMLDLEPGVDFENLPAQRLVSAMTRRNTEACEAYDWPDMTVTEERAFRQVWFATIGYLAGTEVYYDPTKTYYTAIVDTTAGNLPTDPTKFAAIANLDRYIELEQYAKEYMGEVLEIHATNPRTDDNARGIEFTPGPNGMDVPSSAGPTVFVTFVKRPSQFTSEAWDSTKTYARDALVYDSGTGECYLSLVAGNQNIAVSDATKWLLQPLPYELAPFIEYATAADCTDDSQDKANFSAEAQEALGRAMDKLKEQGKRTYYSLGRRRGGGYRLGWGVSGLYAAIAAAFAVFCAAACAQAPLSSPVDPHGQPINAPSPPPHTQYVLVDDNGNQLPVVGGHLNLRSDATINGVAISAAGLGAVPTTRTVNGHPLSSNVTVTNADLGAVPTTTTVNGHALSGNVTVTNADLGNGTMATQNANAVAITGGTAAFSSAAVSNTGYFSAPVSGVGDAFSVGNDAWLTDVNNADGFAVESHADRTRGMVQLGSSGPKLTGTSSDLAINLPAFLVNVSPNFDLVAPASFSGTAAWGFAEGTHPGETVKALLSYWGTTNADTTMRGGLDLDTLSANAPIRFRVNGSEKGRYTGSGLQIGGGTAIASVLSTTDSLSVPITGPQAMSFCGTISLPGVTSSGVAMLKASDTGLYHALPVTDGVEIYFDHYVGGTTAGSTVTFRVVWIGF